MEGTVGELLEMKKKISVVVQRFNHSFRVEYRAGRTPETSDPHVALYRDDVFVTWLAIGVPSPTSTDWSNLYLDLDDTLNEDSVLITPEMLGMNAATENGDDINFLLEAQDYILALLAYALGRELEKIESPKEKRNTPVENFILMHPRDRGLRASEVWHNHGKDDKTLPVIIALEVYDALECFGLMLAGMAESDQEVTYPGVGSYIQGLTEGMFRMWREGEEDEEGN